MKLTRTRYQAYIQLFKKQYTHGELIDLLTECAETRTSSDPTIQLKDDADEDINDPCAMFLVTYCCCHPDVKFVIYVYAYNRFDVSIENGDFNDLLTVVRFLKDTLFQEEEAGEGNMIFKTMELNTHILLDHDENTEQVEVKLISLMDHKKYVNIPYENWIVEGRHGHLYIPLRDEPGSIRSWIFPTHSLYTFPTNIVGEHESQIERYIAYIHQRISPYFRQNCTELHAFNSIRNGFDVKLKDIKEYITTVFDITPPETPGELISLCPMHPKTIGIIHPSATFDVPVINAEEYQNNYGLLTYEIWHMIIDACMDYDQFAYIWKDDISQQNDSLNTYHTTLLNIYQSCKLFRKLVMEKFLIKNTNRVDVHKWREIFYGNDRLSLATRTKDHVYFANPHGLSKRSAPMYHICHRIRYKDIWSGKTNLRIYINIVQEYMADAYIKWSSNGFAKISCHIHNARGSPHFTITIKFPHTESHFVLSYDTDTNPATRIMPRIEYYAKIPKGTIKNGMEAWGYDLHASCQLGEGYNRINYSLFMKKVKSHPDMQMYLDSFINTKWMYISPNHMPYIFDLLYQMFQSISEFVPKSIEESYTPPIDLFYIKKESRYRYSKSFYGDLPVIANDISETPQIKPVHMDHTQSKRMLEREPRRSARHKKRKIYL